MEVTVLRLVVISVVGVVVATVDVLIGNMGVINAAGIEVIKGTIVTAVRVEGVTTCSTVD